MSARTIALHAFVFCAGMCLGLLLGDRRQAPGPLQGSGRQHVFILQRVDQAPEWGPILADWGRTTAYFTSDDHLDEASGEVFGVLARRATAK